MQGPWPWSDSDKGIEATGRYCTPSKYMTGLMAYTVYVEPLDGDLDVSHNESVDD
jgi:hypothetical protein